MAKFRKIERGRNLGVTQGEQKLLPFYPPLPAFSLSTLDGVPLGMTREMDISTVIVRETKSVFLVGKGHLVNDA